MVVCEGSVEALHRVLEGACLSPRMLKTLAVMNTQAHKTFACLDQNVDDAFALFLLHGLSQFHY
jgi:hypothetical protein